MKYFLIITSVLLVVARAQPPKHGPFPPSEFVNQQKPPLHALDFTVDNSVTNYRPERKSGNVAGAGMPSRLENLEPDSEVELIPGAEQPRPPPQQLPVNPNSHGLVPGQRVFIVHMPVAGYRPGTIGGYQPVYIVAASPQANPVYPTNGFQNGYHNGYQNAILLDPSGQPVVAPLLNYQQPGEVAPQISGNPYGDAAYAYHRQYIAVPHSVGLQNISPQNLVPNAGFNFPQSNIPHHPYSYTPSNGHTESLEQKRNSQMEKATKAAYNNKRNIGQA